MYLYNFTLQKPTGIAQAIYGNFSGPKNHEIVVSRGTTLELLRPDENGKMQVIISTEIFGLARSITPFRLTGGNRDYIIVGSDSGRIVILEYNEEKNKFIKVHQETFGKSGCRRAVPGQYLAIDPKGRAVMIAACEKQKLVYILNRDSAANLTISSPLEAHKAHTINFSICGVDVGFENPIFACLEVDYEDEEGPQKQLTFYELDLGLNHVVRKWSEPTERSANLLVTVPGGSDGPGGVLICAENWIIFKNQGHDEVRAPIPRRTGVPDEEGILIIAFSFLKQKDVFFFLFQSEYGDLYKITLKYKQNLVEAIDIKYFDTVPTSISLCVMKNGFLFVASEFGNNYYYQFQGLDNVEEPTFASNNNQQGWPRFEPRREPKNLLLIDQLESLHCLLDLKISDLLGEDTPQIYTCCGRSTNSSLRILRHGLPVSEMAVSPLPGNPSAVWSIRLSKKDQYDKFIIVSFVNATLVLSIGETVDEATDTGFLTNTQTLHIANIGDDGVIQVHSTGIRHVKSDKRNREWKAPGKKTIVHATSNEKQVVIALSGGDVIYFELDQVGQLIEFDKKFMGREVACLDILQVPEGRQRARFLAVGDWDNTVRIFSLNTDDCLQQLSVLALPASPESLCIAQIEGETSTTLYLHIGLTNGVLLRSVIDDVNGELSDTRTRFLGSRPVKLFKIKVKQNNAVLALSSRSWLCYHYHGRFQMTPLSYSTCEFASNIVSEQCPEGIVATSGETLRIITIEKLGEMFHQSEIPLLHTPRRCVIHPPTNCLVILETDHNSFSLKDRAQFTWATETQKDGEDMEIEEENKQEEEEQPKPQLIGEPRPGPGKWASCIRLLDPSKNKTLDLLEFTDNEAATCICTCVFHDRGGEVFVVVGTARDLYLQPRNSRGGFIHIFRVVDSRLELLHKTPLDLMPTALCAFQGRLLVAVGNILRIYDIGKKKILRKCENKNFPNSIISIHTQGERIYVSDISESVFYVKYRRSDNQLYCFADESVPRWLTAVDLLDYDTVCGGDKFGNVFVSRLPSSVSDEIEEDPTGSKFRVDQGYLNGAPHKLEHLIQYHVGETVTSIARASLSSGGAEALIYSTLMGRIGALLPFTSREDVDFFSHLEMYLRQENPPLCGRDHLSYRSAYFPVKNVIDGDLCEQYSTLDAEKQKTIADELDRTSMEVLKKLEDFRHRLM